MSRMRVISFISANIAHWKWPNLDGYNNVEKLITRLSHNYMVIAERRIGAGILIVVIFFWGDKQISDFNTIG